MSTKKQKRFIGHFLLLIWVALCIAYFLWLPGRQDFIHGSTLGGWAVFPDRFSNLHLLGYFQDLIYSLLVIAFYSFGCIFAGMFVEWVFAENELVTSSPLRVLGLICSAFLIGSSVFSTAFLALAAIRSLTPLSVSIVILIGYASGFRRVKMLIQKVGWGKSIKINNPLGAESARAIAVLSIFMLVLGLFHAATRMSYDASATYFSNAKLTAINHRLHYFTNDSFLANIFPFAIQFSTLIQLLGDHTARMLTWVYGLVIVIFGLAIGEKVGLSKHARTIWLALIVTSTAFMDLLGDGKVDLMGTALALASIYWMASAAKTGRLNRERFLLIGFFAGSAFVARPFNVFLLGVFAFLFYFPLEVNKKSQGTKKITLSFYPLFWIGLGAIGWGLYYLVVNWLILGDPFAFLDSISSIDPAKGPWTFEPEKLLLVRVLYLFMVTFINYGATLGNITPLFVAFLPLLLSSRIRYPSLLAKITVVSTVTLLSWVFLFFTVWEIRYVLFLWILLYMPVALILSEALLNGSYILKISINGSLFLLLSFMLLRSAHVSIDAYSSIDEKQDPHCYDSSFCEITKGINETAPLGARVLVLHASRYYLRSDLFSCSTTSQEYRDLKNLSNSSADGFWDEVLRLGYEYVIIEDTYAIRHLGLAFIPSPENLPPEIEIEPMFESQSKRELAYRINASGQQVAPEVTCQRNSAGIWELSSNRR